MNSLDQAGGGQTRLFLETDQKRDRKNYFFETFVASRTQENTI